MWKENFNSISLDLSCSHFFHVSVMAGCTLALCGTEMKCTCINLTLTLCCNLNKKMYIILILLFTNLEKWLTKWFVLSKSSCDLPTISYGGNTQTLEEDGLLFLNDSGGRYMNIRRT